jgi:hypothetical protein
MEKSIIPALMIGRKGSVGFPGKNTYVVFRRALMEYPLMACRNSKYIYMIYVSTDDDEIKTIARQHRAHIINRPPELCTKEALGENAFVHGYYHIKKTLPRSIEFMVLLHCNAPMVTGKMIDEGVEALRENPTYDSAVSVSRYNMWSPMRARKVGEDGLLHPFIPFEVFGDVNKISCDRDSQGDVWFADMGVSIVRPHCLENIKDGLLPQKWMGKKIYPLKQEGGLDVDYRQDICLVEHWIRQNWDEVIK